MPREVAFSLRFPISMIRELATQYSYNDDRGVAAAGQRARESGFYSPRDFLLVCGWKTNNRSLPLANRNSSDTIVEATRRALATDDPADAIQALVTLSGVGFPVASMLLHLASERYPVLDFRALWSVGLDSVPRSFSFRFWRAYVQFCRTIAAEAGIEMRELDRALWEYSKQHQPG